MKTSGIYRIVHVASGREYIGQAADISVRWHGHRRGLRRGQHHAIPLLMAWRKYGEDAFAFEVLELCSTDDLNAREQHHIDSRKPRFNTCPVAGSTRGVRQSAAATAKKTGRKASDETRARMRESRAGKTISVEQRAKIAAALTGRRRPPEVVAKYAAAMRGRVLSEDVRKRMGEGQRGRKHSPELIAKRVATRARNKAARQTE